MGELAPIVAQAARDGDAVSIGLVNDVADEIASYATASIRRLGLEEEAVPVTLAGGLARGAADLLVPRVTALVRELALRAEVTVLHAPPVLGAALLGLDRAGARRPRGGRSASWSDHRLGCLRSPALARFVTNPQLVTVRQRLEADAGLNQRGDAQS